MKKIKIFNNKHLKKLKLIDLLKAETLLKHFINNVINSICAYKKALIKFYIFKDFKLSMLA